MADPDRNLIRSFRFQITLLASAGSVEGADTSTEPDPSATALGTGGFQECTGLDIEQDVQEYVEGGRNNGVIKRVGRGKYSQIVLKRGMFFDDGGSLNTDLWDWMQDILDGVVPVRRFDGRIDVYKWQANDDDIVASWTFERGLPAKISGPQLNAKTGEIAIEELHIAHEGLRLVPVGG
jgi:phage tail-like protein